jgi:hypothetical protein
MFMTPVKYGLGLGLLVTGLGVTGAAASVVKPTSVQALAIQSVITPAAMCGYTCRSGGRYIPGPPGVCAENGLSYCGPSRGAGGPPAIIRREGYGGYGDSGGGGGCRTITIERDDGSVRRVRRCD